MTGHPPQSGGPADAVVIPTSSLPPDSDPDRGICCRALADVNRLRGELDEAGQRAALLRSQVEDLTLDRDELAHEVTHLRKVCGELTGERDVLARDVHTLRRERNEARAAALANAQERDALLEALDGPR